MKQSKSAWAEIHVDYLENNLRIVRSSLAKPCRVCGVLKADAYGHGLAGVMRILSDNHLVDMIAVGKFSELAFLNRERPGDSMEMLLLGAADTGEIGEGIREGQLDPARSIFSVYSMRQFQELESMAEALSTRIRVHIRIDGWNTGMGVCYEEFLSAEERIFSSGNLEVCGVYSHLYTSYSEDLELNRKQLQCFDAFIKSIRPEHRELITVHILNSALVFSFPEYCYDMVRVGTALYGLACGDGGRLRPVMRICAKIFEVCDVDSSAPLSYESALSQGGKRRIARIMLGYWDIPLLLTQKDVRICIRGRLFYLADGAVLLGEEGVMVGEICERNGIHYVHSEWLCMTAGRLEKVYV